MTATCKEHSPVSQVDTSQCCGEKKARNSHVLYDETIHVLQHVAEGYSRSQLGHHLGINSVCNQCRAYPMTRYVANKQIKMILPARHCKSKITADRTKGLKMRFDTHATPDEVLWCEAFLDTGRERQLLFHLLLPLLQLLIRFAKLFLDSLLFGNVRKCDYAELAAIRRIHRSCTNDHRQAAPVFLRQNEFEAIVALPHASFFLLGDHIRLLRRIEMVGLFSDNFCSRHADHLFKSRIDRKDPSTIIAHNHAFIQGLKNALHMLKPLRSVNVHRMPLFQTVRRSRVLSERLPSNPRLVATRKTPTKSSCSENRAHGWTEDGPKVFEVNLRHNFLGPASAFV